MKGQEGHRALRDAIAGAAANFVTCPANNNAASFMPSLNEKPNFEDFQEGYLAKDVNLLCLESGGKGELWKYSVSEQQPGKKWKPAFHVLDLKSQHNPITDLVSFVRSCIVPEGYPDSVSPSYKPYMQWRALKYFFGGAMGVFTTRSLLYAAGVTHGGAAAAVAVNWVIKDGAGRVGKMLFARHGKKFDYDMKQLRFTGDLLMELGVGLELATVAAPHLFLPLACAANISKNVSAVTSTSTRAPIYKAFARGENIGDVTAKGECISNIADLFGTGLGIFISRRNPSLIATFAILSCGYLCSSYHEVKSVLLPSLNKARFGIAAQSFLDTGKVPTLSEGNQRECVFLPSWRGKDFVLGARVKDAFPNLHTFATVLPLFQKENYLVTYNSSKRKIYAILKEKANSEDVLRAAFHAELLLHIVQRSLRKATSTKSFAFAATGSFSSDFSVEAAVAESCKHISNLYGRFKHEALSKGWIMAASLLNPGDSRLRFWKEN